MVLLKDHFFKNTPNTLSALPRTAGIPQVFKLYSLFLLIEIEHTLSKILPAFKWKTQHCTFKDHFKAMNARLGAAALKP